MWTDCVPAMSEEEPTEPSLKENFAEMRHRKRASVVREFIDFLAHNKKWWLLPIIIVLLLLGALLVLTPGGVAPFIYSTF